MTVSRRRAHRVLVLLLLVFAAIVVAVYFRQAWALLAAGPQSWILPELGQTLRFTGLPHAREAIARAATAAAGMAIVLSAIAGAGRLVVCRLLPFRATTLERIVLGYAFGAGVLAYSMLALAYVGAYRPGVIRPLLTALAVGSVGWFAFTATRLPRPWRLAGSQPAISRDDLPWAAITMAAALLAGFCALAPEAEFDALWYHLEIPRRWLAAGRPVDDVTEYVSLYPFTWELLFGGAFSLGGPVAARLLHWTTLPVAAALVVLISRRVTPRTSPWLAAAVFVTAPTVFWEATTTYIDLAFSLHAGAGVYALLRARDADEGRWLTIAGLQFGLACATKHLGLVAVASALVVFGIAMLRQGGFGRAARASALVLGLALLVPSPWYARAWVASGNPVFPEMYGLFGASPPERWSARAEHGLDAFKRNFGRPRTGRNLLTLPWDMTIHPARYGGTAGPLFLAFLPLGILAARAAHARALLLGAAIFFTFWASPLSSYQMRFLLPCALALSPFVAAGMQLPLRIFSFGGAARLAAQALIAVLLLANLPPWTPLHEGDRKGWSGWLTHVIHQPPVAVVLGGVSAHEYLRDRLRSYGAWSWIDANTPETSKVLTFFGGDHFYTDRRRLWSESVTAHPVTWGAVDGSGADIPALLSTFGVTHVLAPSAEFITGEYRRLDLLNGQTLMQCCEPVYADRWTVVYRVRGADAVPRLIDQR